MNLPLNRNALRWIVVITAFLLVALILWNTNIFFQKFKQEERQKMEVLAAALENMSNPNLDVEINLELKIFENNKNIPMILTNKDGIIDRWGNLAFERSNYNYKELPLNERMYLDKQLKLMKSENKPLYV